MTELNLLNNDVVELEVEGTATPISKVEWGKIYGEISNQEDLQSELDSKANVSDLPDMTLYRTSAEQDIIDNTKANNNEVVHNSGNETISGEKSFTGRVIIENQGDEYPEVSNIEISTIDGVTYYTGYGVIYDGHSIDLPSLTSDAVFATTNDIQKNIVDGEDGSIHQINATNIGSNSVAYGTSTSGSKAFSVTQLSNDKRTFTFTSTTGLSIGLIGNVYINDGNTDTNYMMFGSIESISGNNVTFDNVIAWSGGLNLQDSYIWFNNHPELGNITIGNGAIAEGFNTNATQIGSHSEGINTIALGKYSHAEGSGSIAGGYCSTAIGRDTITKGLYAFASGRASEGNGDYSFAGIQGKANGNNSLAIGTSVEANGGNSIAFGHGSKANGEESISIGLSNLATEYGAISVGNHNNSTNVYSIGIGYGNTSSGNTSVALNKNNIASGEGSLATGIGSTASGYASSSFGTGTKASGGRSLAIGYNTEANATTSFSGGATSKANYESSFAFGTRANTSRSNQVVFGRDNADNPNALFIIGDGSNSSNKHNAFEITSNSIKIGNTTLTESQLQQLLALIQ